MLTLGHVANSAQKGDDQNGPITAHGK